MFLKTRLLQLALILFVSGIVVWVQGQSPIDGIDARAVESRHPAAPEK